MKEVRKRQPSLMPDTTAQQDSTQDSTLSGQRRINLIWEVTQSIIALIVVLSSVILNSVIVWYLVTNSKDITAGQTIGLSFLNLTCGIIIGFYFSRTNHQAIGGTGAKPHAQPYEGR